MAGNVKPQPDETRIAAGKLVFDELAFVARTRDVLDVIKCSDAEEPDGGGHDDDPGDVLPDQVHSPAGVSVGGEDDEGHNQRQRPQPTPLDEHHVENVVLICHVRSNWRQEILADGAEDDKGDIETDLDVSLDEDDFAADVKEEHLEELEVIGRGEQVVGLRSASTFEIRGRWRLLRLHLSCRDSKTANEQKSPQVGVVIAAAVVAAVVVVTASLVV